MLSTVFSPKESRKVLGGLKISGSDTMSQAVISRETEIIISVLPSDIKEGDTFLFSESRVSLHLSLLGIYAYPCSSASAVQLCPSHRAPEPSISLGLKHNLEFRHFLLNWGMSTTLSQRAVTEQKRDNRALK